jgi:hypothetical protein
MLPLIPFQQYQSIRKYIYIVICAERLFNVYKEAIKNIYTISPPKKYSSFTQQLKTCYHTEKIDMIKLRHYIMKVNVLIFVFYLFHNICL